MRAVLLAAAWAAVTLSNLACRRHVDPNTPEGRARAEARAQERERDEREAEEKRARKEARKREKEEERQREREDRRARDANAARAGGTTQTAVAANVTTGSGTCDASCTHYLTCKGTRDPGTQRECVAACGRMNLTPAVLAGFERTHCANAISIVERPATAAPSQPKSTACQGCVWDGSSCIWLSQSNWGAGPYSGAYSSCDPSCCR